MSVPSPPQSPQPLQIEMHISTEAHATGSYVPASQATTSATATDTITDADHF